jgi:hypothetical protein
MTRPGFEPGPPRIHYLTSIWTFQIGMGNNQIKRYNYILYNVIF